MKKILLTTSIALAIGLSSSSAMASDGTVTINGSVVAAACTVDPLSKSIIVTLPVITPASLGAVGDLAGRTRFEIKLTGCTTGNYSNVLTSFSGPYDDAVNGVLRNTASGTAATNLGVRLLKPDDTKIDISAGSAGAIATPIVDGEMTLKFMAAYEKTLSNAVTEGDVQAIANFDIGYN